MEFKKTSDKSTIYFTDIKLFFDFVCEHGHCMTCMKNHLKHRLYEVCKAEYNFIRYS